MGNEARDDAATTNASLGEVALIPAPRYISRAGGTMRLPERLDVAVDAHLEGVWPLLSDIATRIGRVLSPAGSLDAATLVIEHAPGVAGDEPPGPHDPGQYRAEEYALDVRDDGITIRAADLAGALAALRTWQQLMGPAAFRAAPAVRSAIELPLLTVRDWPAYPYRGVLLDVARHFMPKHDLLRFIDLASAHKLNVLHLHLTDDQGWRIEIAAYPRLTEVGAWRRESQVGSSRSELFDGAPHGGFYSQADLREIVAFAASRGMRVIPEIDVPGHSQAAIAAYPSLSAAGLDLEVWTRWGLNPNPLDVTDEVLDFFRTVLDEVVDVVDSEVVSLGGDEVPYDQWQASERAAERVRREGLSGPDELLGWFVGSLAEHLARLGRRTSVWDEVGPGRLPRNAIVNAWRGRAGALTALAHGHDVVMCPEHEVYLDHRQAAGWQEPTPVGTVHTLDDVYRFEVAPDDVAGLVENADSGRVLGAQACVWTEQLTSSRWVDYTVYPRLCAFAEAVWSAPQVRDVAEFRTRLAGAHVARLDAAGVEYRPLAGPRPWQQRPERPGWPQRFTPDGALVRAEDAEA